MTYLICILASSVISTAVSVMITAKIIQKSAQRAIDDAVVKMVDYNKNVLSSVKEIIRRDNPHQQIISELLEIAEEFKPKK